MTTPVTGMPRRPQPLCALVIAYDFPPHGAIGTMRTLRLVRQLHDEGWSVTVLTGSPATYVPGTPLDPTLEAQIPAGVRVLQVRAFRPLAALQRLLGSVRSRRAVPVPSRDAATSTLPDRRGRGRHPLVRAFGGLKDFVDAVADLPDKESGWIMPAILRGVRHAMIDGRPDAIYSTAPPWSGQVIALALARLVGVPWMADFRDPWARAPWRDWRRPFRQRVAAALERLVVERADRLAFVTKANLTEFSTFYGSAVAHRFDLIPNGCDPSELEGTPLLPPRNEFVLLHAGTLYGARTPVPVLRAIAAAADRGALDRRRFRLRLLGHVSPDVDLPGECRRLGIQDVVEIVPRVTRSESLREMKSASALLLIQTGTTVSVPGKTYEYLATGRPVLALTEEGETADLVRASGIGVAVRPQDPLDSIESALLMTMERAAAPISTVPPALFDGWTHARSAERILRQLAANGRQRPALTATNLSESAGAASAEESNR